MADTKLWYNKSTTNTEIKKIIGMYNDIVTAAQQVSKDLTAKVNKKGKWNDANSVMFAKWWNENKSKGAGGALKWDANDKCLVMSKGDTYSDGEDRIKLVVNAAGCAFFATVCKTIKALESNYSKDLDTYLKQFRTAATNSTYTTKYSKKGSDLLSGDTWHQMMKKLGGKGWSKTTLPTKKASGGTSTKALNDLIADLNKDLKTLNNKVIKFSDELKVVANNTKDERFWGFSKDATTAVRNKAKLVVNTAEEKLESFAKNTKTALTHSGDSSKLDIKKLNTNY